MVDTVFENFTEQVLSKDSVAVIHLIGTANKLYFERKISKLSEEKYQKFIDAVVKLIINTSNS